MRVCEACGQAWASARFLDPTIETACANCGGRVVRLPEADYGERPETQFEGTAPKVS